MPSTRPLVSTGRLPSGGRKDWSSWVMARRCISGWATLPRRAAASLRECRISIAAGWNTLAWASNAAGTSA